MTSVHKKKINNMDKDDKHTSTNHGCECNVHVNVMRIKRSMQCMHDVTAIFQYPPHSSHNSLDCIIIIMVIMVIMVITVIIISDITNGITFIRSFGLGPPTPLPQLILTFGHQLVSAIVSNGTQTSYTSEKEQET